MSDGERIYIFDTTLRDGQQCPGAGMSYEDNLKYFELASKVRIDVVEAGFPSASAIDFEIVEAICSKRASMAEGPIVAGLCQLREEQVDLTLKSLSAGLGKGFVRLHTYLPVSPTLMKASLGKLADKESDLVELLHKLVLKAVSAGAEVEFSPEGYSRQGENFSFVADLIRAAVSAGASVINCPDTIGGASQYQGEDYFVYKMNKHAEIISSEFPDSEVCWSVHCHNDFGLALDNSLNGVTLGPARQIEGCINGVGERAGNVSLEQCVMVLKKFAPEGLFTNLDTTALGEISDFIASKMLPRQPHTPVCGDNAARHSSGGHTNAILKDPLSYQPFDPSEVGKSISLVFGPLSGGNHAKSIIEEVGYVCSDLEKADLAQAIKEFYKERRKGITNQELMHAYFVLRSPVQVTNIDYSRQDSSTEVHLEGRFFSKEGKVTAKHEGPDSALAALKNAIDQEFPGFEIANYSSRADGRTVTAKSLSEIVLSNSEGKQFKGEGEDSDITIAAMKALISAVNRAYIEVNYRA